MKKIKKIDSNLIIVVYVDSLLIVWKNVCVYIYIELFTRLGKVKFRNLAEVWYLSINIERTKESTFLNQKMKLKEKFTNQTYAVHQYFFPVTSPVQCKNILFLSEEASAYPLGTVKWAFTVNFEAQHSLSLSVDKIYDLEGRELGVLLSSKDHLSWFLFFIF